MPANRLAAKAFSLQVKSLQFFGGTLFRLLGCVDHLVFEEFTITSTSKSPRAVPFSAFENRQWQ